MEKTLSKVQPKEGKMHDILGIPAGEKITDHYTSGKALYDALMSKVGDKKKVKSMLAYAANINSEKDVFDKALKVEGKKVNPWAICTASVGREDKDKYERCVMDIKKKQGMKESLTEEEEEELSNSTKFLEFPELKDLRGRSNYTKEEVGRIVDALESSASQYKFMYLCNELGIPYMNS
jgi:hypothetical protein